MEFFDQIGKMAIGSRLRLLTDKITTDAADIYKLYEIDLQPKWFPVFHILSNGNFTITEIAQQIGHSHPSVSKIVTEMAKKGLIIEKKDKQDGRKNVVSLSKKGKELTEKIKDQYTDVTNAVEAILSSAKHDLWKAIEEWEFLLNQKSLYRYVIEQKKQRESALVNIVPYEPIYAEAFKKLNEEWISTFFKMEEADYKALDHPKEYILDKGGEIFVALYNEEPVGVCALVKMNDPLYDYELAKMAVSPKAQGKNIGWLLGQAIIDKAKALGAKTIYLESNTDLKAAINLYQKLGFKKVIGRATPYERCNIQMELRF
ncbi:transcriptional regulator, MarR family with acetyltransferase activity [Chitinophaga sp. CF118]|uniref:bifunctional helix-turn-helix transcriptional regulator/GNAT family N-acetyltransferase n=1 Tax=Chitinophaga sp. CF118 TaxID=1884367 RepID=UPI0008ECF428|nr:bifunctional helix-turn-helix transcriptional regulator/GNAT family N-acetyltransferase [Chitinophaga sp. CF118]SFE88904.1 transcriptional regulator, MarR family with acetyltransferase activity [Chitinophaga sp. CF118]